jgi:hypothetical protein
MQRRRPRKPKKFVSRFVSQVLVPRRESCRAEWSGAERSGLGGGESLVLSALTACEGRGPLHILRRALTYLHGVGLLSACSFPLRTLHHIFLLVPIPAPSLVFIHSSYASPPHRLRFPRSPPSCTYTPRRSSPATTIPQVRERGKATLTTMPPAYSSSQKNAIQQFQAVTNADRSTASKVGSP